MSDGLKYFVQACVIATQIEVDCIDRGFLEVMWFVKDAEPVFIIDTLKSLIDYLVPGNDSCKLNFQKKMNEVYTTLRTDMQYSIADCSQIVMNPNLIISSVNRAFNAINYLMNHTPIAHMMQEEMQKALKMMSTVKPCSPENAKIMIPPAPTNYVEAFDHYETVRKEKAGFIGTPSKAMVIRWVTILMAVITFLQQKSPMNPLIGDANDLANAIIDLIKK